MGGRFVAAALCLLLLCAHPLVAAPTSQPAPISDYASKPVTRTHIGSSIASDAQGVDWQRLILAMGVVIGVIIALRYAIGLLYPSARAGRGSRAVRVLTRTPLAPRQQVMLLQVGRRVIVVGESAGVLSSLGHIDEPDEVAELVGQVENAEAPVATGRFGRLFGRARNDFEAGELTEPLAGTLTDDGNAAAPETPQEVQEASREIAGLIDRMRSLTRTMRQ